MPATCSSACGVPSSTSLTGNALMSANANDVSKEAWPALPFAEWKETAATLHMWTQIIGKVRLVLSPWTNHSWHVTLYLTARGLTTSPIPFRDRILEIRFDFVSHELRLLTSDGGLKTVPLRAQSVAQFYRAVMDALHGLG